MASQGSGFSLSHSAFSLIYQSVPVETSINSPQNPRVKNLVRLREGKHRRRQGIFIIEGLRELQRALKAGVEITEFYACEALWNDPAALDLAEEIDARSGIECFQLAEAAFRKASAREGPDGILALARSPVRSLDDLRLRTNPLLLVVEHVEKPGNLGTLLRTADAAGVDAVIVTDPVCDLYNPNCIRASQGAVFSVCSLVADNAQLRRWLAERGMALVATTPEASLLHWQVDMRGPAALLMGSEAQGLSAFWMDDPVVQRARIPMNGGADSLNVAAAAAIFLFEAVRQRAEAK